MRLLLVSERFPPDLGGVARSSQRTALALRHMGHEVHVLAWTKLLPPGQLDTGQLDTGQLDTGQLGGRQQDAFPEPPPLTVHRLGLFGGLDLSLQHTLNVIQWLHQRRPFQAVWGHYLFPAGFAAVTMAQWLGLPSTVSARGNDVDRMMFPPGDFARLLWTLERADVVSAVSRELAAKIDMLAGRPLNVEVLGNSVDTEVFCGGPPEGPLRTRLGIAPPESVLGFCGELRHKKGLPFLLAALAEVRRRRPACLLVIGEIRARDQASLAAYRAEEPAAAARIIVTGALQEPAEVARHLRLCDVLLLPSVWEGLPNALLEAMACERLVLASDAGGISEAVTDRRQGLLIPRAHLHRLGEAACELLELDEPVRQAYGRAARQRVIEQFNAEREQAALDRVLSRLG